MNSIVFLLLEQIITKFIYFKEALNWAFLFAHYLFKIKKVIIKYLNRGKDSNKLL